MSRPNVNQSNYGAPSCSVVSTWIECEPTPELFQQRKLFQCMEETRLPLSTSFSTSFAAPLRLYVTHREG